MANITDTPATTVVVVDNISLKTINDVPHVFEYIDGVPTPPFVENQVPAPGAIDVAIDSDIALRVDDASAGVDQSTINITVNGENAVIAGVIQANYNGPNASIAAGGNAGFDIVLDPVGDLPDDQLTPITVDATDNSGNVMTTVNYSFTTILNIVVTPIEVERTSNGETTLNGNITAGFYRMYIGPNGNATDPEAFNGDVGNAAAGIEFTTVVGAQTTASFYLPALDPGGPYSIFLVPVGGGDTILAENIITVLPAALNAKTLSFRKLLPRYYAVGTRKPEQEDFPQ